MKDQFDGCPEDDPGHWPNDDFLDDGYAFDAPDSAKQDSDPEWFLDYFEGVLEPSERGRCDRMLAADSALARRFDSYCRRVELLRAVGDAERRVDGGSALRARILADVAKQLPPVRRSGSRFAWFASVGLAAASLVVFFALERAGPAPDSVARYDEYSNRSIVETAAPSESGRDTGEQASFARVTRTTNPKSGDSTVEGSTGADKSTDDFAGAIAKGGLERERKAIDGATKDDPSDGASLRVLHLGEGGAPKGEPGEANDRDGGSNDSNGFGTVSILRLAEKELLSGSRAGALEDDSQRDRSASQLSPQDEELERTADVPTAGAGGAGAGRAGGPERDDAGELMRKSGKQVDVGSGVAAKPEDKRSPSPGGPSSPGPSSPGRSFKGPLAPSAPVNKGPATGGPEIGAVAGGAKKSPIAAPDGLTLQSPPPVLGRLWTRDLQLAALHIEVPRADLPRFYDWVSSSQLEAQPLVGGASLVAFAATTPVGWMEPRKVDKLGTEATQLADDDAVRVGRERAMFDTSNISQVASPRPSEQDRLLRIGGERAALVRGAAVLLAKSEWKPAETVVHFGLPAAGPSLDRGLQVAKGAPTDQASRPDQDPKQREQAEYQETLEERAKSVDLDRDAKNDPVDRQGQSARRVDSTGAAGKDGGRAFDQRARAEQADPTQRAPLATRALRADTAQSFSMDSLLTFAQIHDALRRAASANGSSLLIYLRVVDDGSDAEGPDRQAPFVPPATAPETERIRGKDEKK
ncbi:MAG: hypothetical protein H6832_08350 [Planctomycetes bacterium]|nr:hypothetical protein [Planctomycetota bacterium]MCB9918399.1 hypothetical protein [Planctomycetota bacterium]